MAIVGTPKQIAAGRSGDFKSDFNRSYVVVFQVIVDNPHDGPATVVNAPQLPRRLLTNYVGFENTNDAFAICTDLKPTQDGNEWKKWLVTCTFATHFTPSQNKEDPQEEPPIFSVETEFVSRKITKYANGDDILNSAGELCDGVERQDAVETWVFEKNYSSINRQFWKDYQNTVNSDAFYELAPKEGLLHIIVPKPSYRLGVPFWRVQYRIRVNPDKWTVNLPDRGAKVKGDDGKLHRPVDCLGQPLDGEVFLDGEGGFNDLTEEGTEIVFLGEKDIYRTRPFSQLGL